MIDRVGKVRQYDFKYHRGSTRGKTLDTHGGEIMPTFHRKTMTSASRLFMCFLVIITFGEKDATTHGKIDIRKYRDMVKRMFYHAYDGYIKHAYPYDELRPLTCDGHDTWGSYSLTLIDALDTLAVMGNYSEFRRVSNLLIDKSGSFFDMDINVSVFESNIRVVGGLLSAHLMMKRAGMVLEPGWPCSGPLLRMAENIARKLLPAFDTPTGMPYGTVNLRHGVPVGETPVTCTAGVGTFIIEFGTLSRLTGDPVFEKVAMRAMRALWKLRSLIGLVGNHIDVITGKWTALDSGIGGGVDSYFEYLVKGAIMFNIPELLEMFREYEKHIVTYLKRDDWYMWANMKKGGITLPLFTSLDAYWPGIQSMLGDLDSAMKTIHNFHQVWQQFGATPEFYNIPKAEVHQGREGYPLRPELIESTVYLYRATHDPFLLQVGVDIVESIEHVSRTSCGYATVKDVRDHRLENRMESFFLAETTKYLYLLFDQDNFLHNNGSHGTLVHTPNGDCVIDTGGYIFNTEAHPMDLAAVHCCSAQKKEEEEILWHFHDNLNLLELLDIGRDAESKKIGKKLRRKKRKESLNEELTESSGTFENAQRKQKADSENHNVRNSAGDAKDLETKVPSGPSVDEPLPIADNVVKQSKAESEINSKSSTEDNSESAKVIVVQIPAPSAEKLTSDATSKAANAEGTSTGSPPSTSSGIKVHTIQAGEKAGAANLAQQILDLFSTVGGKTEQVEVKVPNVQDLYQTLANYSIAYTPNPSIMRCPAQPFHSRLSVWGEMFESEIPSE
ncbi:hypothetical protein BaRGS_00028340 [Batillaria attramentaria]|uniref:alpha-1,2-Mannosidase n=1 Tax=Batillaria attramentaria TaxID=370345 RepID=A0ABD0K0I3_9CAEN